LGLSAASLSVMMQYAEQLVKIALIFSVGTSLAAGIVGFMKGNMLLGGLGLLSFAVVWCYAYVVWARIPFAATNLNTALSAVRANMGLTVASFAFSGVALGWTTLWSPGIGNALAGSDELILFLQVCPLPCSRLHEGCFTSVRLCSQILSLSCCSSSGSTGLIRCSKIPCM
jgi:hypothetical protein